jgi:hypothetical protein
MGKEARPLKIGGGSWGDISFKMYNKITNKKPKTKH